MPAITIGKETIHFEDNHARRETALIAIHGSGGSCLHWPVELCNMTDFRVLIPDLPGHGQSSGTGQNRVEDYADFIEAFVTSMKLKRAILMGHSLGGAIAMMAALRSPAWLSGLILVGTGARLRVTQSILDGLLTDPETAIGIIVQLLFGPAAAQPMMNQIRAQLLATPPHITHGDFSACDQFDIMDRIHEIAIPTLVISGIHDKLTPPKYGEFLCKQISGAAHKIIPDAGHLISLENTTEFISAIHGFELSRKR